MRTGLCHVCPCTVHPVHYCASGTVKAITHGMWEIAVTSQARGLGSVTVPMDPGQELETICELGARPRVWSRVGMNVGRTWSRKRGTLGSMYSGLGLGLWLAGPETFRWCPTVEPFRGSSGRSGPQPCAHCSSHSVFATLVHNPVICLLSPCLLSHFPAFLSPFPLSPSPSLSPVSPSPAATSGSAWGSVPWPHQCSARDGTGAGHVQGGCSWVPGLHLCLISRVLTSASLETVLRIPTSPKYLPSAVGRLDPATPHPSGTTYLPLCVWFLQRPVGPCSSLNCLGLSGSTCQACFPGTSPIVVECFCGVGLLACMRSGP